MKLLTTFTLRIMRMINSYSIHLTRKVFNRFFKLEYFSIFFLFLFLPLNTNAEDARVEEFEVKNSRAYAYHIGDTLNRSIHLQLRKPYKLKTDLLPKQKRMGRWLLITEVNYESVDLNSSTQYDIDISYQIINIIPELKELALPRHYLTYVNSSVADEKPSQLEVPLSIVGVSAVTNVNNEDIQLDVKPGLLTQTSDDLLLYGGLLLLALAGLAFLLWGSPFSKKEQPFSDALRSLKKMPQQGWDGTQKEKALKVIHQAFNRTANKTVFTEKTDEFFTSQKHFLPLRKEIELFFTESKGYFFKTADDPDSLAKPSTLDDLISFVKSCQKVEQGKF